MDSSTSKLGPTVYHLGTGQVLGPPVMTVGFRLGGELPDYPATVGEFRTVTGIVEPGPVVLSGMAATVTLSRWRRVVDWCRRGVRWPWWRRR